MKSLVLLVLWLWYLMDCALACYVSMTTEEPIANAVAFRAVVILVLLGWANRLLLTRVVTAPRRG